MDYEKDFCPVVKVDGFIEKGKQFDLEINLPEDNRNVIYGVIKDCYKDPVENAVVKLIEIFISNTFEGDRHLERLNIIMEYENAN